MGGSAWHDYLVAVLITVAGPQTSLSPFAHGFFKNSFTFLACLVSMVDAKALPLSFARVRERLRNALRLPIPAIKYYFTYIHIFIC